MLTHGGDAVPSNAGLLDPMIQSRHLARVSNLNFGSVVATAEHLNSLAASRHLCKLTVLAIEAIPYLRWGDIARTLAGRLGRSVVDLAATSNPWRPESTGWSKIMPDELRLVLDALEGRVMAGVDLGPGPGPGSGTSGRISSVRPACPSEDSSWLATRLAQSESAT